MEITVSKYSWPFEEAMGKKVNTQLLSVGYDFI